ncbi:MAG: RNA polymerase sigma factor FliA [Succinivibrio sp.]|nr:RNA polymerase sigma factor FliA [Succinivibrio sp.]
MLNGAKVYQAASRDQMSSKVEQYAPMVKRIALHLKARLPPNVELDDLIQSGMIGLLDALAHYEEGHGASFETYATIRVRGAMIDEMRQSDWAPRSVHQSTRQIADAINRLSHRLGREPRDTEIAAELNVTLERYQQMLMESSTSQMIGIEDLGVTEDVISDSDNNHNDKLFELLASVKFKQALAVAISKLPQREQYVLSLYYDEELNLKEIGRVLELSESRVCQIMSQSMARLRAALKDWRER